MGITDWKNLTVSSEANWRMACKVEEHARLLWSENWGWIPKELEKIDKRLRDLKECRYIGLDEEGKQQISSFHRCHLSSPLPYPETSNKEIGWLASKKDWALEVFGPYPGGNRKIDDVQDDITSESTNLEE